MGTRYCSSLPFLYLDTRTRGYQKDMKLRQLIVGKIEYLEQQNKRFDNFRVYRFFSIFPLFFNS